MPEITREEFLAHMEHLAEGMGRVEKHLEALNGRTRTAETKIAILEDRADRNRNRSIGAGLGAVIVGALEAVHLWVATK